MPLAISWGDSSVQDGGLIYLDAVQSYTQSNTGKVTSHPVDGGSYISDHFVRDNRKVSVSAVITGIDISTGTYLIQDLDGNSPFNSNEAPTPVSINSTDRSVLQKFLPDSIGQFMQDTTPEVVIDTRRADLLEQIREAMISLMSGTKYNEKTGEFDPEIQIIRLFEYDGTLLRKITNNLVMTSLVFKEDPSSGYALYCDMTFEQVTFAFLKKSAIPKDVIDSLKKKSASKSNKGKQDSTAKTAGDDGSPKDTDPLRQAKDNG